MQTHRSSLRRVALGLAAAAVAIASGSVVAPRDVEACGGFFSRSSVRKTSLSYEQVLIVHDPAAEKEHLIREVAFRGGAEPFGFVVPTPSRPEVAKVDKSPFTDLRRAFPFRMQAPAGTGKGAGFGSGHGRLGGHDGVSVLEVSKVGSFTAFVLAADDESGLASWLKDNGLVSTPEADVWLAHYVRMKFFYVAMRYDPPQEPKESEPKQPTPLKAETIRISFSTPLPYYPYFEPKPPPLPGAAGETPLRLLELWMVSPAAVTPIGAKTVAGKTSWLRPMQEGAMFTHEEVTRKKLEDTLENEIEKLLPGGPLVVQTYQDQKYAREGYGDVLFAPIKKAAIEPARAEKLRPLLGILDPALVPEKGAKP